jgi:hypothetical protein
MLKIRGGADRGRLGLMRGPLPNSQPPHLRTVLGATFGDRDAQTSLGTTPVREPSSAAGYQFTLFHRLPWFREGHHIRGSFHSEGQ